MIGITICACGCGRPAAPGRKFALRQCAPFGHLTCGWNQGPSVRKTLPEGKATTKQLAAILGVSETTIYRLMRMGLNFERDENNGKVFDIADGRVALAAAGIRASRASLPFKRREAAC